MAAQSGSGQKPTHPATSDSSQYRTTRRHITSSCGGTGMHGGAEKVTPKSVGRDVAAKVEAGSEGGTIGGSGGRCSPAPVTVRYCLYCLCTACIRRTTYRTRHSRGTLSVDWIGASSAGKLDRQQRMGRVRQADPLTSTSTSSTQTADQTACLIRRMSSHCQPPAV